MEKHPNLDPWNGRWERIKRDLKEWIDALSEQVNTDREHFLDFKKDAVLKIEEMRDKIHEADKLIDRLKGKIEEGERAVDRASKARYWSLDKILMIASAIGSPVAVALILRGCSG